MYPAGMYIELNGVLARLLRGSVPMEGQGRKRKGEVYREVKVGVDFVATRGRKAVKLVRDLASENNITPLWQGICQEKLDQENQQLLYMVNKLSPYEEGDYVWAEEISHWILIAKLGWAEGFESLLLMSHELENLGLISCNSFMGRILECYATNRIQRGACFRELLYLMQYIMYTFVEVRCSVA
jgi:hypothetical protein